MNQQNDIVDLIKKKEDDIKKLLPQTWTHMSNLNGLQLGFGLKLLGFDWRSEHEFSVFMATFEKMGLILRKETYLIRANPNKVFV